MSTDPGSRRARREADAAAARAAADGRPAAPDDHVPAPSIAPVSASAGRAAAPDDHDQRPPTAAAAASPVASPAKPRRPSRRFLGSVVVLLGVLAVLALGGAAASNGVGPRVTAVDVDPAAAAASGARLIVTTTTSLAKVDPSQVTVTPAAPFTVDTSGRSVGVRFSLPLYDDTSYTVRIDGLEAVGGGPVTSAETSFTTPPLDVYALQRGTADGDEIVRTRLDGSDPVVVFTHPHIEDYRAAATHLVVSVRDGDDAALVVTDLDGANQRELPLPGVGFVTNLQSADRGDVIGYTYSDANLSATSGRDNELFTASLKDSAADTPPTQIQIAGNDPSVASWGFVPDTDTILVITFDGRLSLVSSTGGDPVALGTANLIDGIARGSSQAVVDRADGVFVVNLADGSDQPLVEATTDQGRQGRVTPLPGAGAGSVRLYTVLDDPITPRETDLVRVADDGTAASLLTIAKTDAPIQTCISPSGRYAAVTVAPDAVDNPKDLYQLPLPKRLETRIVQVSDGSRVATVEGSMLSWCRTPPGQ